MTIMTIAFVLIVICFVLFLYCRVKRFVMVERCRHLFEKMLLQGYWDRALELLETEMNVTQSVMKKASCDDGSVSANATRVNPFHLVVLSLHSSSSQRRCSSSCGLQRDRALLQILDRLLTCANDDEEYAEFLRTKVPFWNDRKLTPLHLAVSIPPRESLCAPQSLAPLPAPFFLATEIVRRMIHHPRGSTVSSCWWNDERDNYGATVLQYFGSMWMNWETETTYSAEITPAPQDEDPCNFRIHLVSKNFPRHDPRQHHCPPPPHFFHVWRRAMLDEYQRAEILFQAAYPNEPTIVHAVCRAAGDFASSRAGERQGVVMSPSFIQIMMALEKHKIESATNVKQNFLSLAMTTSCATLPDARKSNHHHRHHGMSLVGEQRLEWEWSMQDCWLKNLILTLMVVFPDCARVRDDPISLHNNTNTTTSTGRLPLHHALDGRARESLLSVAIIRQIWNAYPDAIRHIDPVTQTFPFMTVWMMGQQRRKKNKEELEWTRLSFDMLRNDPSTLQTLRYSATTEASISSQQLLS